MNLSFTEDHRILRQERASLALYTRLPQLEGGSDAVAACYTKAAQSLQGWAADTLLPELEKALAEAPRRNRLHATLPRLSFCCEGSITDDRWVSLTLTVLFERNGSVRRQLDCRVWDGKSGKLCPVELFLPRKEARRYQRWWFSLKEESVWGIFRKKDVNNTFKSSTIAGKMKKFPAPY